MGGNQREIQEKVFMAEYPFQNMSAWDQTIIPQNAPGRGTIRHSKHAPLARGLFLRTSRHRNDMSSGVHVQETYWVWSRNTDPWSKEMYVFCSLGEMSSVHSCGLCVCGGPFVLLCGKWHIPTKLFVPSVMTLNLPSPPPADDLKRGNAYFYFGSWFERLTLLSIILFPCLWLTRKIT